MPPLSVQDPSHCEDCPVKFPLVYSHYSFHDFKYPFVEHSTEPSTPLRGPTLPEQPVEIPQVIPQQTPPPVQSFQIPGRDVPVVQQQPPSSLIVPSVLGPAPVPPPPPPAVVSPVLETGKKPVHTNHPASFAFETDPISSRQTQVKVKPKPVQTAVEDDRTILFPEAAPLRRLRARKV